MGLLVARRFGRSASDPAPARPQLRVLRADGQRIDLHARDTGQMLTAIRQSWQAQAWAYRALIPELRFANRLLARHVARVRFYPAQLRDWPADPVPLAGDDHDVDPQLAADALTNFDRIPFDNSPDGFTARLTENLSYTGEVWVHIDPQERFWVRSISEITASQGGEVKLTLLPGGSGQSTRNLDRETEELLRCWLPHPEWGQLADAPMSSLLDTCEDAVLAGREQRAAARSRLAANGVLLLPNGLSLALDRHDDRDGDSPEDDPFMQDFTEAVLAPVRDDSAPEAVVPLVIRGEPEDLEKVRHFSLSRPDAELVIDRQQTALLRLLKGLDIQPEQVEGVGGTSHWNAWVIDSRSIRDQIQPMAEAVATCLMQAYLRPALESLGYDGSQVDDLTIAVDVSPLAENPNRGQDARDAWDRFAISDSKLREDLGYDDDDKPPDEEVLRRMAVRGLLSPELLEKLLGLDGTGGAKPAVVDTGRKPAAIEAGQPEEERPIAQPGQTSAESPVPDTQPSPTDQPASPTPPAAPGGEPAQSGMVAAAVMDDGWRVDTDLGEALAELDLQFADRLQVAADDAVARALEKAGARVKGRANKDRALSASLVGVDAYLVPSRVGREKVESFAPLGDFLGDEYARLKGLFRSWLAETAQAAADMVVRFFGLSPSSERAEQVRVRLTGRLARHQDEAWTTLTKTLDDTVERVIFEPDPFNPAPPDEPEGAEPVAAGQLVRPREIRDVLRVAGGGQALGPATQGTVSPTTGRPTTAWVAPTRETTPGPGGYGTGPDVTGILEEEGGVLLGWEWRYHPELPRRRNFRPYHTQLDGVRFATWTDPKLDTEPATAWIGPFYHPQDHLGCLCSAIPVLAVPELDDDTGGDIVLQRLREARQTARGRAVSAQATEDEALGRVGTSMQNEIEVRDRIADQVQRLRAKHIEGHRP